MAPAFQRHDASQPWRYACEHFTLTHDPLRGLVDVRLGRCSIPQLLGVEIVDAIGLGPHPLAEPGMIPETIERGDVLIVDYKPTAGRPVECVARWRVRPEGVFDLEVSALTPGKWAGLSVRTRSTLAAGTIERIDPKLPLVALYRPATEGWSYAEMCHPNDAVGCDLDAPSLHFRLFGHDLEKGVILRGRLRGVLLPRAGDADALRKAYEAFLAEPANLSI